MDKYSRLFVWPDTHFPTQWIATDAIGGFLTVSQPNHRTNLNQG